MGEPHDVPQIDPQSLAALKCLFVWTMRVHFPGKYNAALSVKRDEGIAFADAMAGSATGRYGREERGDEIPQ
jgi:hypothetical protein